MTLRDLVLRVRALFRPRAVEQELDEELAFHLEKETLKLVQAGLTPAQARVQARARFGSVALTADQCRDARGISFVTSFARDLAYALRMFRRAPLPALTIVGTLGLGLSLVAVIFTVASPILFRVDAVPNPGEIVEVRARVGSGEAYQLLTRVQLDALRRDTRALTDPFGMAEGMDSRIEGRMMTGTAVSGNFFQALGVHAATGRTLMASDDDAANTQRVLVLSHRGWQRRFDADPAVVGRMVIINGAPFQVVGVMPEGFNGLAISAPDYWAPLSAVGDIRPAHRGHEAAVAINIVGRLRPGVSRASARDEIAAWHARLPIAAKLRDVRVELLPRLGTTALPAEALIVVAPLFAAFGLILVIACANVANLLLARGVSRQREIGIRLSIGATRARIVRQLLTENLLLALAAAGVAFFLSRMLVRVAIHAITGSFPPEVAELLTLQVPPSDWRVVLFLIAGAFVSTMVFALSPSLQATRLQLVRVVRGEIGRHGRPQRARNALIVVQVSAAALLLTCSAIFLRSALAAATFNPGYRVSDTILVKLTHEEQRRALLRAVESSPMVAGVGAMTPDMLGRARTASVALGTERLWADYRHVSPDYMRVFDLEMSRGRGFFATEQSRDDAVAIVSESLARRLRPDGDVLGRALSVEGAPDENGQPSMAARTVSIVGVRKDIAGFRMIGTGEADLYLPTSASDQGAHLVVKVRGDVEQARRTLLQDLTAIDPDLGQVISMRTMARLEVYMLQIAFWITVVLGTLALVLTLSGLFSVLSYLVEQRTKEIGVRMTLGADARTISLFVFSQTFRPVGLGVVIGSGLALAMAVSIRAVSAELTAVVHVLDPVAYALSMSVIVAACASAALVPAWRAVRVDPVTCLRQE